MSARANQLWNESDTLMKSMKSFKMKLMKLRVQNAEMRKHIQNEMKELERIIQENEKTKRRLEEGKTSVDKARSDIKKWSLLAKQKDELLRSAMNAKNEGDKKLEDKTKKMDSLLTKFFPDFQMNQDEERMSVDPMSEDDDEEKMPPKTMNELATSLGFIWPIVKSCETCGTHSEKELSEIEEIFRSTTTPPLPMRPPSDCKVDNNNNNNNNSSSKHLSKMHVESNKGEVLMKETRPVAASTTMKLVVTSS